jgi:hypothetical protein
MMNSMLMIAALLALFQSGTPAGAPAIIDNAQRSDSRPLTTLDRPFGSFYMDCEELPTNRKFSVTDVLGPNVRTLTVRRIGSDRWPTFDAVRGYINRALVAATESGRPLQHPWSEGTDSQLSIRVEWKDGRLGRMDLGHGPAGEYAHFEDWSGCEWFTRLGPEVGR